MRASWFPRVRAAALTLLVSGCSGGGCSSCAGGAVAPIPGGYPLTPETRVARAVQMRLTRQGLEHVQAVGPDLILSATGGGFDIPPQRGNFGVGRYVVCPPRPDAGAPDGGLAPCRVAIDLPDPATTGGPATPALTLAFAPPDRINADLRVRLHGTILVDTCTLTCNEDCTSGFACGTTHNTLPLDTRMAPPPFLGLRTSIAIRRDAHAERLGYFSAQLTSATGAGPAVAEITGQGFDANDVACTSGFICPLFPVIRPLLAGAFSGAIGGAVAPIQDALSHPSMPSPPGCPAGTRVDGTHCRYRDDSTVPTLLGLELGGNFGALLQSFSAGLHADGAFVLAAGDPTHDAEITAEGMTLNLFGAARSLGHSACVPRQLPPAAATVPEWRSLRTNTAPGSARVPDLAMGIAEEFLNQTFYQFWDAGMFCLGVTSALQPDQLNAMRFTLAVPSLADVITPERNAALTITLRPQRPPRLTVLTEHPLPTSPVLSLAFERLELDLYAWSEERFVRALTVHTDVTIPLGFTDMMGLRPVLGTVTTANTTVTNAALVSETPTTLARNLDSLLGFAFGSLGGSIPAITLPAIAVPGPAGPVGTVNVRLPADGLRGVDEMSSRFLGVYADLQYTTMRHAFDTPADAGAALVAVERDGAATRVRLRLDPGPSGLPLDHEYAWRVDGLTWSHWTRETDVAVTSPALMFRGEHRVEVVARRAGDPDSVDRDPAVVRVTVGLGDAAPAQAAPAVAFPARAAEPVVVAPAPSQLIRGGLGTDAAGGCGCSAPGRVRGGAAALPGLALALAGALRRRNARPRKP